MKGIMICNPENKFLVSNYVKNFNITLWKFPKKSYTYICWTHKMGEMQIISMHKHVQNP